MKPLKFRGALLLIVVLAIAVMAFVAIADEGEATKSGEPLPPWGMDWWITQDTVYTDEVIRIDGMVYVMSPYTLSLDGSSVIIDCSWFPLWTNGIYVEPGATLYMNKTASNSPKLMANVSQPEIWFYNDGEAYINDAIIQDIDMYGMETWGAMMYIEGSSITASAYGQDRYAYGVRANGDVHVGNTTIKLSSTSEHRYHEMYGVNVRNSDASLHNLDIQIVRDQNITYNSTYYYGYSYTYGIYLYSADAGKLVNDFGKEFSISITIDVDAHNYYMTSSTNIRQYFYTYALYLSGNTICKAIKGFDISVDESFYGAAYNGTSNRRIYLYNNQRMIYSTISSSGQAPTEIADITIADYSMVDFTPGGNPTYTYEGISSYGLYFSESSGARPSDIATVLHDISITDSNFYTAVYVPRYPEVMIRDNTFDGLDVYRVLYMSSPQLDYTVVRNTFSNLTSYSTGSSFIYMTSGQGEGVIEDNVFENNGGYRMFYISSPADRMYIQGNTFENNVQEESSGNPYIEIRNIQDKMTISENTFKNNDMRYLILHVDINDKLLIEDNLFEMNTMEDYMIRSQWSWSEAEITNNTFLNNVGPIIEVQVNYDRYTFQRNTVKGNNAGADYIVWTTQSYSDVKFTDNVFEENTADGAILFFRGITYWSGAVAFTFERNTFTSNTASHAMNGGIVVLHGPQRDLSIRRNVFEWNEGNCINFYQPYFTGYRYSYTFTVDGNSFDHNEGVSTIWVDFSGYNIVVKRNTGTDNSGPLIKHVITDRYVYDYDQPQRTGQVTGPNSFTIDQNNYSYNRGGAVDLRAQWSEASAPYSLSSQTISLKNNVFQYNGDDYSIKIVDFGLFPQLHNNDFFGSKYGVFLDAIDFPALFPRTTLVFEDEPYDGGGPNGMTAWGLVNVDAEFYNCSFTQFEMALYAKDCQIDVYWSAIPEASGHTEGRGYIYVYNNIEFLITWADATDTDSGAPAVGATLALLGTNGMYVGELTTNVDGRIGPMLIFPWSSIEGRTDAWSPYSGTILAGGLTAHHTIHAIGEQVGANAVHLLITDDSVPEIVITTPSEGSTSNMVDLPVEGFLFEVGSGVDSFMGFLDAGPGIDMPTTQIWNTMFAGLSQGPHTLFLEVMDVAGNTANTSVTFNIDAEPPTLDISDPADGHVTRDALLLIQGTFGDDVSGMSEIVIRINGEVFDLTTGSISEYITLTEGVNTIEVDATDAAGNRATVRLTVTLDTYAPTLYVYTPLHNLVTAMESVEITGLSEADTPILIEQVLVSTGEPIGEPVPITAASDGTFSHMMTLVEGGQHIIVTAKDPAGNVRTITRTVELDTQAPNVLIDEPSTPESFVNTPTISLVGHIEDPNPVLIEVYINELMIVHSGVFSKVIPLSEGLNTITVRAVDPVGNFAMKSINVTRDTTAPAMEISNAEFLLTSDQMLEVKGTVNSDADTVTVAGDNANIDEQLRFSVSVDLADKTSPIVVVATDKAGNSVSYEIAYVFDAEKPDLVLTPSPPATTDSLVLFLNGSVNDNKATIDKVMVWGDPYPIVNGKFSVLVYLGTGDNGWNNFTIMAQDEAGNVASQKVSIQYIPPKADGTVDDGDDTQGETLSWIGLLLLVAGIVLIATVIVFSSKRKEVRQ
jgi:hypothetical protein